MLSEGISQLAADESEIASLLTVPRNDFFLLIFLVKLIIFIKFNCNLFDRLKTMEAR